MPEPLSVIPIEKHPVQDRMFHYGSEPAWVRYLQPGNAHDLEVMSAIANWPPAKAQMEFPGPRGMQGWVNESDRKGFYYTERSFVVCEPNGEPYGFINAYPAPELLEKELAEALRLPPVNRENTLFLYFTAARRPGPSIPGLMASGRRQVCLQLEQMVRAHSSSHPSDIKIISIVDPDNIPSRNMVEASGSELLGVVDGMEFNDGKPTCVYEVNFAKLHSQLQ